MCTTIANNISFSVIEDATRKVIEMTEGDKKVGSAVLQPKLKLLDMFTVSSEFRGKGYGRRLWQQVLEEFSNSNVKKFKFQAVPYEYPESERLTNPLYKDALKNLVDMYKHLGAVEHTPYLLHSDMTMQVPVIQRALKYITRDNPY